MAKNKKERMLQINQMLLEMAAGNFFYKLKRSKEDDGIEAITVMLNMLSEEILESMMHQGFVNLNNSTKHIVQMSFVLDNQGNIQMVNQKSCYLLSILHSDMIGEPFGNFLSEDCLEAWNSVWIMLQQKKLHDTSLKLIFKTKGNLTIPNTCYITTFREKSDLDRRTLITTILHTSSQIELEQELRHSLFQPKKETYMPPEIRQKQKLRLSFDDIRKLREAREIIINNLDRNLPSLKKFALQLGTNEFKLKYGFKELYGTSVHQFLMQERLRNCSMLIQHSDMALKSIAYKNGFKSISHFSRAFKKRFGYVPSSLRK
ncbi:helix-turn-helix domain-containing protein [Confluentibacter sediminis]|uniref:helix-turn-helix domain-containing protein n=1 Tax=Confluentibacter sediminis TaxID=2219045 RepID=UPI000DAE79E8|nr:helix-turn-helix domain-containing protein [Confluentibacter sediminis]